MPTGVSVGPFKATLFLRTESRTCWGRATPSVPMVAAPAFWVSQSKSMPVAVSTRTAAATTSGPMPSPGMRVTV